VTTASAKRGRWRPCCLRAGPKGKRYSLPHSRILFTRPHERPAGPATDIDIYAKEILRMRPRR